MSTVKDLLRSITSLNLAASGNTASDAVDAIKIVPTANAAAADLVTITNASFGQASALTIPDPANAAANFVLSTGSTVSGNLVQSNGTSGQSVDSGISASSVSGLITQVGNVTTVSVTLNPTQMAAAYATPVQLVAAPGAGKVIIVQEASVYTASTGNTAYATGTAPIIQYGTTVHGGGTNAVGSGLVAGDITAASSQVRCLVGSVAALTGVSNTGIYFSNATGAYTAGTGTNVTFNLTYQTITATV